MSTLFQRLFDLPPSAPEQADIIINGSVEQRAHLARQLNFSVEDCLKNKVFNAEECIRLARSNPYVRALVAHHDYLNQTNSYQEVRDYYDNLGDRRP